MGRGSTPRRTELSWLVTSADHSFIYGKIAETDKNIEKQEIPRRMPILKNLMKIDMNRKEMKHMLLMMIK